MNRVWRKLVLAAISAGLLLIIPAFIISYLTHWAIGPLIFLMLWGLNIDNRIKNGQRK